MGARVYVFDHPYYAVSKADGTFAIPQVPAGVEVFLMVHHEDVGWILPERKDGRAVTLKTGKNEMNFEVKSPFGK
jgi:hypothetical protein